MNKKLIIFSEIYLKLKIILFLKKKYLINQIYGTY